MIFEILSGIMQQSERYPQTFYALNRQTADVTDA